MSELHDQIAELKAEIETLSDRAERCRKIILLAKLGALAGGLGLVSLFAGLFQSSPVLLIASVTALLGGIALAGSSQSTLDVLERSIEKREVLRAQIGDCLRLRAGGPDRDLQQ